jgi:hypothetical protein
MIRKQTLTFPSAQPSEEFDFKASLFRSGFEKKTFVRNIYLKILKIYGLDFVSTNEHIVFLELT